MKRVCHPCRKKWKGKCENGTAFSPLYCNKKLIGARFYYKGFLAQDSNASEEGEYLSPRDFSGHGTHTASTAVGNHVPGASYFGYARGTAIGVAPCARLAIYKVLWGDGGGVMCDILAGMEQAILDGVDIMSLSLGDKDISHLRLKTYFTDFVTYGSLSAIEKGIFVVCAAGNNYQFKTVSKFPTGSGNLVKDYVTRVKNPKVKDMSFVLTRLGTKPAPQVAKSSSKGPNPISPGV